MLVALSLGQLIASFYPSPYSGIEVLDLFNSFASFPTEPDVCRQRGQVHRSERVLTVDNLEGRQLGAFTWASVVGKLSIGKQFIPPFGILLYKDPK